MSNNKHSSKVDTMDFLAFSEDQPSAKFYPSSSSSPQVPWKYTPKKDYNRSWNKDKFQGNFRNNSFNNSYPRNRSFNIPNDNSRSPRPHHFYHSFNSPNDKSWSRKNSSNFESPKGKSKGDINILDYLHPSFMEDPWAKLELKLKSKDEPPESLESDELDKSS